MFTRAKELQVPVAVATAESLLGKGSEHACKSCLVELKINGYKKSNETEGDSLSKEPGTVEAVG